MSPRARRKPLVELYLVLRADGTPKRALRTRFGKARTGHVKVYIDRNQAIAQATDDGDAVVLVTVGPGRKPVFIRGELLTDEPPVSTGKS